MFHAGQRAFAVENVPGTFLHSLRRKAQRLLFLGRKVSKQSWKVVEELLEHVTLGMVLSSLSNIGKKTLKNNQKY